MNWTEAYFEAWESQSEAQLAEVLEAEWRERAETLPSFMAAYRAYVRYYLAHVLDDPDAGARRSRDVRLHQGFERLVYHANQPLPPAEASVAALVELFETLLAAGGGDAEANPTVCALRRWWRREGSPRELAALGALPEARIPLTRAYYALALFLRAWRAPPGAASATLATARALVDADHTPAPQTRGLHRCVLELLRQLGD